MVTTVRAARVATVGTTRAGRFLGRNLLRVRERGAGGETGMLRLLDLHAASCAGDTLIALGLAGTVFFSVPAGEARGRVALYLLITMLPFALLAPVVGPVLDRFRHGRRYALAVTMLGRAFLAFMLSEHLTSWLLYPAAFGMLVLSRAYGVARSAAVPRVLPPGLGLSEAGARASVFGTFAGAIALPIGLLAGQWGPQWPLRVSILVFLYGMVTALRLPPRADSDPPETVPSVLRRPLGGRGVKVLSGSVVISALVGSATLRALYGFLTLYLAFAIKEGTLPVHFLAWELSQQVAVVVVAGALGVGSFLATAIGTRLRIHRPALLQAIGLVLAAFVAVLAADRRSLGTVALLCLFTAIASGLAKLAVDASIQERIDEKVRASAFAHSETLLMIAWVLGGAVGLIPFADSWGLLVAAAFVALGAARALYSAVVLRRERLRGAPPDVADADATTVATPVTPATSDASATSGTSAASGSSGTSTGSGGSGASGGSGTWTGSGGSRASGGSGTSAASGASGGPGASAASGGWRAPGGSGTSGASGASDNSGAGGRSGGSGSNAATVPRPAAAPDDGGRRGFRFGRRREAPPAAGAPLASPAAAAGGAAAGGSAAGGSVNQAGGATKKMPVVDVEDGSPLAPPGYTLYRPSGNDPTTRLEDDER